MSKHYIYEIFGKKIGVTNNIARRMMQQSIKENEYRIIEEHTNAKTASYREIELQKEYNYPVDKILYWKVLQNQKKTDRKEIASKIDWVTVKAKVDWNTALKTNRSPKMDYKSIFEKRDNNAIQAKRVPKIYKAIDQYNLEGKFIKEWDSAKEAATFFNKPKSDNIGAVCRGKQKTAYGFIWKFKN
jgi:hypothetical protein